MDGTYYGDGYNHGPAQDIDRLQKRILSLESRVEALEAKKPIGPRRDLPSPYDLGACAKFMRRRK